MYNVILYAVALVLLLLLLYVVFITLATLTPHFHNISSQRQLLRRSRAHTSTEVWLFDIMGDLASFNIENIVLKSKYTKRNDREKKHTHQANVYVQQWNECEYDVRLQIHAYTHAHKRTYAVLAR